MNLFKEYINEIEERKGQGLHPKPIDGAELLSEIIEQSEKEKAVMDDLKAKGKEKTATYKQYMGNRLIYNRILSLYKEYGLID